MKRDARRILEPYIARIAASLRPLDPELTGRRIARLQSMKDVRLEPWEISAFQELSASGPTATSNGTLLLFAEAAALRIRIQEEATELAALEATSHLPADLRLRVDETLELGRELDQMFGDLLSDETLRSDSPELDHLYRSRFRLLRGYSGLWLIYDQRLRERDVPPRH